MPSAVHEALVELVRAEPEVAADLVQDLLDVPLPDFKAARVDANDLTEWVPTEYRADAVVVLTDPSDTAVSAIVVEVQRTPDTAKSWSWPVYLATVRARLRCDTFLVVIAPDARTARCCAAAIRMGHPNWVLTPLVVGPHAIPIVTDPELAEQQPWLAVLSALAHHDKLQRDQVFGALLKAADSADRKTGTVYIDIVTMALPDVARRHLEALMASGNYQYKSAFARKYFGEGMEEGMEKGLKKGIEKGRQEGRSEAIVTVLTARRLDVPPTVRQRLEDCRDPAELERWLERAATATTTDDLFT